MKKVRLYSILLVGILIWGCSSSSSIQRPEYKPMDRPNYQAVELWENSGQYHLATIMKQLGSVELSFGSNGTIKPYDSKVTGSKSGFGISMVLDITNKGENDFKIDLKNTIIKDQNGQVWNLSKCETVEYSGRTTSSAKIVMSEQNYERSDISTNKANKDYNVNEILEIPANSSKNYFLTFTSDYLDFDSLPESFTFIIQCGDNNTTTKNHYKFDRIAWQD